EHVPHRLVWLGASPALAELDQRPRRFDSPLPDGELVDQSHHEPDPQPALVGELGDRDPPFEDAVVLHLHLDLAVPGLPADEHQQTVGVRDGIATRLGYRERELVDGPFRQTGVDAELPNERPRLGERIGVGRETANPRKLRAVGPDHAGTWVGVATTGTQQSTVVPRPGSLTILHQPPASVARSRIAVMPRWP